MNNQKDLWYLTKGYIKPNEFKTSEQIITKNGEPSVYISKSSTQITSGNNTTM